MKEKTIPPYTIEQVHALVGGNRMSQFQFRRRCDRYLLALCLSVLAVLASILWHTAPAGATAFNIVLIALAVADLWVAQRAARSLWLMRKTLILRSKPLLMTRYSYRLNRLSHRRRLWLDFILRGSYGTPSAANSRRSELVGLRIPSYSIAACFLLLLMLSADKAFAASPEYDRVTSTTSNADLAICDSVYFIIAQL